MSRVQAWLESFLTPLSKIYGEFEYTKDSTDILIDFEKKNDIAQRENWNFDDILLFGIDVQALYPSILFLYLQKSLEDCFETCTKWPESTRKLLIELIMYTLKNQQLFWNQSYYILNKGTPTGGKHCVPLANIFLSYIIKSLFRENENFKNEFKNSVKLWKRYIDDCGGVFIGQENFGRFFMTLEEKFAEFGLKLTHEVSKEKLVLLDIEIYIDNNRFETKEHRKETASNSYIKFGSSHPSHCFKGIIKSQMIRLRRLCSKDSDFISAISSLKTRCIMSGYDPELVQGILSQAGALQRRLESRAQPTATNDADEMKTIRWVVLSGTSYEKNITTFTRNINELLKSHNIRLELVKSTGSSLGRLLFNNREKYETHQCNSGNCSICAHQIRDPGNHVASKITRCEYKVDKSLSCTDSGIYRITCPCSAAYTGKTTTSFGQRFDEHFKSYHKSSINDHSKECPQGKKKEDYKLQFLENVFSRGKYTLSEREFLWNERLGGEINIQKILRSS